MSYSLLSATRFDPVLVTLPWNNGPDGSPSPYLLLPFHLARLRDAAHRHCWPCASSISLRTLESLCQNAIDRRPDSPKACKIRIILAQSGELTATATPAEPFTADPTSASLFNPDKDEPPTCGPILTVYIDTQSSPTSLFTSTKTTCRDVYNDARSRGAISASSTLPSDVILYNSNSLLTEASIYNIAVYRSSNWVTPSVSTGCLPGVLRRWLLEQGRIRADNKNLLTKDSVKEGEWVLLFNGVQGCRLGKITLYKK